MMRCTIQHAMHDDDDDDDDGDAVRGDDGIDGRG